MGGQGRSRFVGMEFTYLVPDQLPGLLVQLEQHARAAADSDGVDWDAPNTFMLGVVMPCGSRYLFRRAIDIPNETLVCNCGHPGHLVVLYTQKVPEPVRQNMWP